MQTASWTSKAVDLYFNRGIQINELLKIADATKKIDRVVYFDDSRAPCVLGFEECQVPAVFYSIDVHHHYNWHKFFGATFQRIMIAQKDYLSHVSFCWDENPSKRISWLPLWAPIAMEPVKPKTIAVSFRGTLNDKLHPLRLKFFRTLGERLAVDYAEGPYSDVYPRSKIVVNQSVSGDLNFRVFEGMMAGALVVTPYVSNGQTELFDDRVDFVVFERDNVDQAEHVINYYLQNEDQRTKIAAAGREKVLKYHSAKARAIDLERILKEEILPLRSVYNYSAAAWIYLLFMTVEAENLNDQQTIELLQQTVCCLKKAASKLEPMIDDSRSAIFLCKARLLENGLNGEILPLSKALFDAYPTDLIISLNYIEDLLQFGAQKTALKIASGLSDTPEELLASIPGLMLEARKQVIVCEFDPISRCAKT